MTTPELDAAVKRLDLPAKSEDYSRDDWKKHNAATNEWFEKQNEPPPAGAVEVVNLTAGSPDFGRRTIMSRNEIDREVAEDARRASVRRDRAPRLQSVGLRRRTCAGDRRPGGRRRVTSSSSSRGDPDEPEPAEGGGRPDRHLALARPPGAVLTYAVLAASARGAVAR
jgi:hypothetical protein